MNEHRLITSVGIGDPDAVNAHLGLVLIKASSFESDGAVIIRTFQSSWIPV